MMIWRMGSNRLPITDRLPFSIPVAFCPFCHLEMETSDQLFFKCLGARATWFLNPCLVRMDTLNYSTCHEYLE